MSAYAVYPTPTTRPSNSASSLPTVHVAESSNVPIDDDAGKKKKTAKRRKVTSACLYCRRSHMTCDDGRPCQRCIKREIGHLCHDEQKPKAAEKYASSSNGASQDRSRAYSVQTYPPTNWPVQMPQARFVYQPETLGNEFSVLSEFLDTLDDGSFFTPPQATIAPSLVSNTPFTVAARDPVPPPVQRAQDTPASETQQMSNSPTEPAVNVSSSHEPAEEPAVPILPAATKTERFLLTAADQESGSRDERLNRVIRSKYEAGLLKPYNYVKGYARLSRWMDRNVSQESKQQILQPLSVVRPKFRAVAQSLRDLDLVFIEEAFERLLLDYDRVFSAMGVPACLWRRTGEIYKGNREFTELVGVDGYLMRDGRLCIYELMAEESAVNYWEKYGHVAFDSSQKAVLTTCVLRYKPVLNPVSSTTPSSGRVLPPISNTLSKKDDNIPSQNEEGFINCCFSFTIRRDKWGIPTMIVGNFIRC